MPISDHEEDSQELQCSTNKETTLNSESGEDDSETWNDSEHGKSAIKHSMSYTCCQFTPELLLLDLESIHNDGKGIQVSVLLMSLLLIPKAGKKQRVNAKPPVVTKIVYVHKDSSFLEGLIQIICRNLERKDLCQEALIDMVILSKE